MEQWKDTRFVGVALLAALLIGAGPPAEKEPGPSLLFEAEAALNWGEQRAEPEARTYLVNQLFAVPQRPGALLGGDDNFLVYPPNLSEACEHCGEGPGVGDDPELQEPSTGSLMFGLGVNSDAGFTGSIVLNESWPTEFLAYWDSVMPSDTILLDRNVAFGEPVPYKPGHTHFLFTGRVPQGRKLLVKQAPARKQEAPRAACAPIKPMWPLLCNAEEYRAELERQEQEALFFPTGFTR
jgi:hypothetical protein